ncbi:MAG: Gfo/Idh/MocA family oxidoreductase [Acetatifactor sp.]|nr:Gfo/Idh/MocA family oxidoreductase [Acetatifactor sp.]
MIKVGMADISLDNWHANHYPSFFRDAVSRAKADAGLSYAFAKKEYDDEFRITNGEWCKEHEVISVESTEDMIKKCDAFMVMCADDCRPHEELAMPFLKSGKPVYCDKTFAPDVESAKRMFETAKRFNTPVFSCSAQRFCKDLLPYYGGVIKADFASSVGPGDLVNYSVHQFEMIEAAMGPGVNNCVAYTDGDIRHIVYKYGDGRLATFTQAAGLSFHFAAGSKAMGIADVEVAGYYEPFMDALVDFFTKGILPVKEEDTMEIMLMQQMARKAVLTPGKTISAKEAVS